MAAAGILSLVYVSVQIIITVVVYKESKKYDRRSPVILATAVFVISIIAALVLESIYIILVIQAILSVLYYTLN